MATADRGATALISPLRAGTGVALDGGMRLSDAELERVIGGGNLPPISIDPTSCTPSNPSGKRIYTQSMEPDHSGPSISQRVIDAYDKAMAPWQDRKSVV